uniref:Spen paralogue and orthologue SPOC C-terminal domain-containing protein n=1 Tax=Brassica oleracea var. oleracea TaxID=109376 RepID=A0A0D3ASU1_BRAOL
MFGRRSRTQAGESAMDQEDKMVVPPRKEPEVEKKQKQEQKALNEKDMDTNVDIRSLVRKTHKGEFQVEVELMDSGSVEISVGSSSSSLNWICFHTCGRMSMIKCTPVECLLCDLCHRGEKTTAKEWPMLLEIKGRVRLDAFEKFVRELPNSRSRAVMFMCFVCKEACSKTEQETISEVVDSYSKDERVRFAEPVSVVELYLCPTRCDRALAWARSLLATGLEQELGRYVATGLEQPGLGRYVATGLEQKLGRYVATGLEQKLGRYVATGLEQKLGRYVATGLEQKLGRYVATGLEQKLGRYVATGLEQKLGRYVATGLEQKLGRYVATGLEQKLGRYVATGLEQKLGRYVATGLEQKLGRYFGARMRGGGYGSI